MIARVYKALKNKICRHGFTVPQCGQCEYLQDLYALDAERSGIGPGKTLWLKKASGFQEVGVGEVKEIQDGSLMDVAMKSQDPAGWVALRLTRSNPNPPKTVGEAMDMVRGVVAEAIADVKRPLQSELDTLRAQNVERLKTVRHLCQLVEELWEHRMVKPGSEFAKLWEMIRTDMAELGYCSHCCQIGCGGFCQQD